MHDAAYAERDKTIATVFLNRPERLNALDLTMAALLVRHFQELVHDDTISSIVITGRGRGFCAGGDLGWAAAYPGGPVRGLHIQASHLHQAVLEIHRTGKPVIAAVNGVAAGTGFSPALACDFRTLDETATLRQAYTTGLSIDGGETFMLPRLAGLARALEIAALEQIGLGVHRNWSSSWARNLSGAGCVSVRTWGVPAPRTSAAAAARTCAGPARFSAPSWSSSSHRPSGLKRPL